VSCAPTRSPSARKTTGDSHFVTGADVVEARYDPGILEVTVPVKEQGDTRQLPVAVKR
jgi:HSP20 family molecular chaperone IbpA